jgi:hypothetical protein
VVTNHEARAEIGWQRIIAYSIVWLQNAENGLNSKQLALHKTRALKVPSLVWL